MLGEPVLGAGEHWLISGAVEEHKGYQTNQPFRYFKATNTADSWPLPRFFRRIPGYRFPDENFKWQMFQFGTISIFMY